MLGNWKGFYKFDNEKIQKIIGHNETEFEIIIDKFDGKKFSGKVSDDEKTGGMKETGEIIGKIENNEIYFEKLMPKNYQIHINGERERLERKHPTIYYFGKLSNDGKKIEGSWKFKKRLGFLFHLIPIIYNPGNGTWKMELKKNSH